MAVRIMVRIMVRDLPPITAPIRDLDPAIGKRRIPSVCAVVHSAAGRTWS